MLYQHLNILKRFIYYPEDAQFIFRAAQDCALLSLEYSDQYTKEGADFIRNAKMDQYFEDAD